MTLVPDVWRAIARHVSCLDDEDVINPLVGFSPAEEIRLTTWRPGLSPCWQLTCEAVARQRRSAARLCAIYLVCKDVCAALDPLWQVLYRAIAQTATIPYAKQRVANALCPRRGLDPSVELPARWYRLRLALYYDNPAQRIRYARKPTLAKQRLIAGYENRKTIVLKSHYRRIRAELAAMQRPPRF